ncbi:MAG: prepilin-type N-terminal cleavage/methylation domain-containing protein [Gemmatimonadota bacterium]
MLQRLQRSAPNHRNRRGLTLVEVLIAIIILGIATTMLGSTLARSVSAVADSRLDLLAATTQVNRLESLRVAAVDSCPPNSVGSSVPGSGLSEHWSAVRSGVGVELTDSLGRNPARPGPDRVLTAQVGCP